MHDIRKAETVVDSNGWMQAATDDVRQGLLFMQDQLLGVTLKWYWVQFRGCGLLA